MYKCIQSKGQLLYTLKRDIQRYILKDRYFPHVTRYPRGPFARFTVNLSGRFILELSFLYFRRSSSRMSLQITWIIISTEIGYNSFVSWNQLVAKLFGNSICCIFIKNKMFIENKIVLCGNLLNQGFRGVLKLFCDHQHITCTMWWY